MNELLSAQDMIERLQISRSTLMREVERGRLHEPIRIGRQLRWRYEWLQKYLRRREDGE